MDLLVEQVAYGKDSSRQIRCGRRQVPSPAWRLNRMPWLRLSRVAEDLQPSEEEPFDSALTGAKPVRVRCVSWEFLSAIHSRRRVGRGAT